MSRHLSTITLIIALSIAAGCAERPGDGPLGPQFAKPGGGGGGGGGGGTAPPANVAVIDLTPAGTIANPQDRAYGTGLRGGIVLAYQYLGPGSRVPMRLDISRDAAGNTSVSEPTFLLSSADGGGYTSRVGHDGRLFGADASGAGYFTGAGTVVLLPAPADADGTFRPSPDIELNRAGVLVGSSSHPDFYQAYPNWRATVWYPTGDSYSPALLPILSPTQGEQEFATGIDGSGVIAAFSRGKGGAIAFLLRPDGTGGYEVAQLTGKDAETGAMNEDGTVVGSVSRKAVRWTHTGGQYAAPEYLAAGGEGASRAFAINDAGEIVGQRSYKSRNFVREVAVLWRCSGTVAVELPPVAGYTESTATQIDDDGYVIGRSWDSGRATATLWDVSKLPPC